MCVSAAATRIARLTLPGTASGRSGSCPTRSRAVAESLRTAPAEAATTGGRIERAPCPLPVAEGPGMPDAEFVADPESALGLATVPAVSKEWLSLIEDLQPELLVIDLD